MEDPNEIADPLLQLAPHLRAEVVGEDRVFLLGERDRFLLQGRAYALAAPLLDGRRSALDIVQALETQVSPPEVFYALMIMQEKGYATRAIDPTLPMLPEAAAFWSALGRDPQAAAQKIERTRIRVHATGASDGGPMIDALHEVGFQTEGEADLVVVVTDDYLAGELDEFNREALATGMRWWPLKPLGLTAWMGPLFRPGGHPCWACLASRLRVNTSVETFLTRRTGRRPGMPRTGLATTVQIVAKLAAVALAEWMVRGESSDGDDRLIAVSFSPLAVTEHTVSPRPQCRACGDPDWTRKRLLAPVNLEPRPKRFTDDGGHRVISPEETLRRCEKLVSPLTGVAAKLGPIPGRDHPLRPVFAATYFNVPARQHPSFNDFAGVAMGKGRTAVQARAGALSEAVERQSAALQGDEPLVREALSALGPEAIGPDALQNFSAAQFENRGAINAAQRDRRRMVPVPFDPEATIDWIPAWSLTNRRRRFLPASYCYVGVDTSDDGAYCLFNPNGHAAGNCLEEAILQASLELAERDGIAIWWYNRLRRPAVNLDSFEQPYFRSLRQDYRALGHEIWVLDLTNDLRIPTFAALSRERSSARFCVGFGCHFDARLGVQRALTELNQLFDPSGRVPSPWEQDAIADPGYLLPDQGVAERAAEDFERHASDDLRDDVTLFVERAASLGLETIVLDQTRPEMVLTAVKVVVPGLRHFWPRFGPGRLYEVPVRLGWLGQRTSEDELNRVPLWA